MGTKMKFCLPTMVFQEKEAVKNHSRQMAGYGKKAFLVTGRKSSRENGALQDVANGLEAYQTAYVVYDRIVENPTVENIMEASEIGRAEGCDFVIGIGGGSPLDAAKAVALMIQNRDSAKEVLYEPVALRHLPVVAVPTTCGTGSEVTPYAILTRQELHTKQGISHRIFPELALVDGKYLEGAPESVIVNTAVDALGHMLESYFSTAATDYSRMFCQYAMEVWGTVSDVLCGAEPEDGDYGKLMFASSLAGMGISHTGTSLPHALSYYLTCHKGIPHGKAVGLFLPGYLGILPEEYNMQVTMALRTLGFGSLGQFRGLIRELLGTVALTEGEITEISGQIMGNAKKLSSLPFVPEKGQIYQLCQEIGEG